MTRQSRTWGRLIGVGGLVFGAFGGTALAQPGPPPPAGAVAPPPAPPPPPPPGTAPPPPPGTAPPAGSALPTLPPPGTAPPAYPPYPQDAPPQGAYPQPYPPSPYGYPPAYPGYPPGYGYGYAPGPVALPPAPRPGRRLHDGFYLQMSPGLVLSSLRMGLEGQSTTASGNGVGVGFNFAIGATLGAGVALAGELGFGSGRANVKNDTPAANDGTTSATTSHFGLLIDWYVDPHQGWHVQGGAGIAQLTLDNLTVGPVQTGAASYTTISSRSQSGPYFNIGGGWETFVGDEWSMGVLLRLDAAFVGDTYQSVSTKATLVQPSLRMTFTFN